MSTCLLGQTCPLSADSMGNCYVIMCHHTDPYTIYHSACCRRVHLSVRVYWRQKWAGIVRYAENLPKGGFTEAIRRLEGSRLSKTIGDPRTEGRASWNGSYCPVSSPYCSVDIYIARHLELTPCIALIPVKVNTACTDEVSIQFNLESAAFSPEVFLLFEWNEERYGDWSIMVPPRREKMLIFHVVPPLWPARPSNEMTAAPPITQLRTLSIAPPNPGTNTRRGTRLFSAIYSQKEDII
jgi:hypothetical protein